MTYEEAISYIHGTLKFGTKLGLQNITRLLELMGNPHKKLKYVHVAGTNGKGSTVAFISSVLAEAGYKVGIYTSPYIERFTERIRINDAEIGKGELARITEYVKQKVDIMLAGGENHPTEFEIVTAIAFQYYYENNCDVVVLEVGLGGRFDSTNVIDTPLVSVITAISYDHTDILGATLPEIAFEKAGVIKPGGDVVIYPQAPEVEEVFYRVCGEKNARLFKADFQGIRVKDFGIDGQTFDYSDNEDSFENLKIALLGEHQLKNAAVAIKTLSLLKSKSYNITRKAVEDGLAKARWPGRLEVLNRNPLFIIDGAHNAEGAKILSCALKKYFPGMERIFIVGVLKDKDYKAMIEEVIEPEDTVIAVTPPSERALPGKKLGIFIKDYCKDVMISDTIEESVKMSLDMASSRRLVCAFGSLYYIGQIRKFFGNRT